VGEILPDAGNLHVSSGCKLVGLLLHGAILPERFGLSPGYIMLVYLIRHGVAVSVRDTPSRKHEDRPLTEDGATRMKVQAASFRRIGGVVQEVWTSPHLRARQSADIVRDAQDTGTPVIEVEDLAPEGDVEAVFGRLRAYENGHDIAIVGHEEGITKLASRLLVDGSAPVMHFGRGAVCCLDVLELSPDARSLLRWHLTPQQLRGLM
jgi:phosphohistidine phosphatase